MHPEVEKLQQLAEIDREIARLNAEVAALPRRVQAIETKLAGVNAEVDSARKTLKEIEAARRKHEGDIQALQQKISKYRDQSLAVKTNQEYRALLDEVAFAEREIRQIEDKILDGMLEAENREKSLRAAELEQKKQQAEVEKEKAQAHARTQEDQQALSELQPKRDALRKSIAPDIVRHYDRVLKLRGSTLAEARDQTCSACHVLLRPQVFQDVMAGDQVLTCESCGRILYYVPPPPAVEPGAPETKEHIETAAETSERH